MILECPHCSRTVAPRPGGSCPVCHENVHQPPPDAHLWRVIAVDSTSLIPRVCCGCGEPTKRMVGCSDSLSYGDRSASGGSWNTFLLIAGVLFLSPLKLTRGLFGTATGRRKGPDGGTVNVNAQLPVCTDCTQRYGQLRPLRVDYDYQRMEFRVHREFAEQFRKANAPASQPAPKKPVAANN